MEQKTLLVAEHIDKRFGITHAVNDVSLTIAAGEIRGLIGENGSIKSITAALVIWNTETKAKIGTYEIVLYG